MTYKTRSLLLAMSIAASGILIWSSATTKWAVTPNNMGRSVEMGLYRMCIKQEMDPKEICGRMDHKTVKAYWFGVQCVIALSVLLTLFNIAGSIIVIIKTSIKTFYLSISSGIPALFIIGGLGVWSKNTSGKSNVKLDYGFFLSCIVAGILIAIAIISYFYYYRLQKQTPKDKTAEETNLAEDTYW